MCVLLDCTVRIETVSSFSHDYCYYLGNFNVNFGIFGTQSWEFPKNRVAALFTIRPATGEDARQRRPSARKSKLYVKSRNVSSYLFEHIETIWVIRLHYVAYFRNVVKYLTTAEWTTRPQCMGDGRGLPWALAAGH